MAYKSILTVDRQAPTVASNFGAGNFKSLFERIKREQEARGIL